MFEEEARSLGLPGSDVFVASHLAYRDDLNRAATVARLLLEAHNAFRYTTFMTAHRERHAERAAISQSIAAGNLIDLPRSPNCFQLSWYQHVEHLLVGTGFEIALKARLINGGFLVHEIERFGVFAELAKAQKRRPIAAEEFLELEGYRFERQQFGTTVNHLRGLSSNSLKFDLLIKSAPYREVLNLSSDSADIINFFRRVRNDIHLPIDISDAFEAVGGVDLELAAINFANSEVVALSDDLIERFELAETLRLQRFPTGG